VVSSNAGSLAYGGTPSDQTVVAALRDLADRGLSVVFSPFILMDIPGGNALPSPYGDDASQPTYPWRGRITCDPAPGQPGTPDKSAPAAAQIAAFVGTTVPGDYALSGDTVVYTGPDEWSLRRMVLHYAWLCKAAGGVGAFVLSSELRGLTHVRDSASHYPFVTALAALAADVRAILGPDAKILYAADWTEYFGHQPQDGSGDVFFHLDPLWSSPDIDAVGIDCYWPLADWRDGLDHLDRQNGARSPYDLDYLRHNVFAGEGYDWYYASGADRDLQIRSPIADGAGKPWVYRFKDLRSWWLNPHYDRPAGAESASPTAWVPESKPVWLMEIGCPAVDKGANQPNVFVDAKSSESALPYYARGIRDDLAQRSYLQALISAFDPASDAYSPGANPVSAVYGDRMLDCSRVHVYAWDARPFPAFPSSLETWGDAPNWRLGHWINGRIASVPLSGLVHRLLEDFGQTGHDASLLEGIVPGYVVDRIMSARDALQPLELAFFFDAVERADHIAFHHRAEAISASHVTPGNLVEDRPDRPLHRLTRAQETDLAASAKIGYVLADGEYAPAIAEARRLTGASTRVASASLPIVLEPEQADAIAETWLHETWTARERANFSLPPSRLAVEAGDAVILEANGRSRLLRVTEIGDHGARTIGAQALDPEGYGAAGATPRPPTWRPPDTAAPGELIFLDLPTALSAAGVTGLAAAAVRRPWAGPVALYRSPEPAGFAYHSSIAAPAITGVLLDPLPAGPPGRWDYANMPRVLLDDGSLSSVSELRLLSGANLAAVASPTGGGWEIVQFQSATLIAARTYRLSALLRGLGGTEDAMAATAPAGSRVVLLDAAVTAVPSTADDVGTPYIWRHGPAARAPGSPAYAELTHVDQGRALRPLSPAHVRADRAVSGDITLTWVRRTRSGGDSWELPDVPLGEDYERYEIDIRDGGTVKRTLVSSTPNVVYSAAAQVADFGSVQSAVTVDLCQLGVTGRGVPARTTV